MTRISLELVPRSETALQDSLKYVQEHHKEVTTINIPDLLRLKMRSWDGCRISRPFFEHSIPHIRAVDFDLHDVSHLIDILLKNEINELLVIHGDIPQEMSKAIYQTHSVKLIHKIKERLNNIKVYATIDPYRSGIRQEFDYIEEKIDAGADGFFTQPFYDFRLLEIYAENLREQTLFWGICPVINEESKNYWESRNRAYFPKDFRPDFAWNRDFGKKMIDFCQQEGFNIYLMPIRIDLKEYLNGIFR
jgi:methylenetetrahydrofolate reductase (NADPH)